MRLATRGSELALWQANHAAELIRRSTGVDCELVKVETSGDRHLDRSIGEIGGQGVFAKEVQAAVLEGRADTAVHSAKDLPSSWRAEGLVLASVPTRGEPRDALVGSTLEGLPPAATVATGSQRRQAQLAAVRRDLRFVGLRGNIARRLDRLDEVDALVVAGAAMVRLGLEDRVDEWLSVDVMLPQVGQGALALECRVGDQATREILSSIEDETSRRAVDAERSFLATLGGGCELPVGAHATVDGGELRLEALIASSDGRILLRDWTSGTGTDIGSRLAEKLLSAGGEMVIGGRVESS